MKATGEGISQKPRIVGVITARGGSVGIPGKNVKMMAGKPLIAWTIGAALAAPSLDRVIVSTDCDEIAQTCRDFGAEVPFKRPAHLALGTTTHIEVMHHALDWLLESDGEEPDYLLLLQPTTPLRTAEDIESAIEIVHQTGARNVVSVTHCDPHPWLALRVLESGALEMAYADPRGDLRRQAMPEMWVLNGAIYLNASESLRKERTFFPSGSLPYKMPAERSVDIDTPMHFSLAEHLLRERHALL